MSKVLLRPSSSEAGGASLYRYYVLGILTLTYTLNFLDRQIIGILAAPLKEEFQLSDSQFGLLGGLAFALLYSTLAVPIAWLADRRSRVWIMTVALTLWSGFTALCGLTHSFVQLFLCRMGVGIGEAGGVAPAYSLIADYFPKAQRGRALSVFSLGFPFGTAAGTLVGGLVAANYGWRAAFLVVGGLGVFVAPLLWLTVREPNRGALDGESGQALVVANDPPIAAPRFAKVLAYLLRKPSFWLLAFGATCCSVCAYGIGAWLPSFFIRSFGLTLSSTAFYYAALTFVGGVVGIWFGGYLADRLGRSSKGAYPLVPAIALLIAVPCFILAMNTPTLVAAFMPGAPSGGWKALTLAFVVFLAPTALNVAWLGPVSAATQHLVPASMRATASSLLLLINNLLGIATGIFYFGWMSDLLRPIFGEESLRWSIYSGMVFYLLAAALLFAASRTLTSDWVD
ncbi:MAG: MFS transporter [Brevundimonas sp.]|jgi:MFS family permease|uniref:spinster family MFS transporter n=1 Tax=Brevundimonas sp. TaxID=1871086 RepID=UPI0025BB3361|nr:MFS transporter [Brevundimonas sp.]MCH4269680.1 MFS transporter [Brevundimonas sp.]